MRKLFVMLAVACGLALAGYDQATCENIGFENGSLSGWTLSNGSVAEGSDRVLYQDETPGTFENGHLLTRLSDGNDPKVTSAAIPMVAPGSNYSIRLGNVTRGNRFDRITTSFVVTPDNLLLQYEFAVVLQYPNHRPTQQPGFSIRVTNQSNATLA